jgi:membrane protease YdiL (CAAX protease family)
VRPSASGADLIAPRLATDERRVVAPTAEELAFRGVVLPLLHTGPEGLSWPTLGLITQRSGSVAAGMVAHAVNDLDAS